MSELCKNCNQEFEKTTWKSQLQTKSFFCYFFFKNSYNYYYNFICSENHSKIQTLCTSILQYKQSLRHSLPSMMSVIISKKFNISTRTGIDKKFSCPMKLYCDSTHRENPGYPSRGGGPGGGIFNFLCGKSMHHFRNKPMLSTKCWTKFRS